MGFIVALILIMLVGSPGLIGASLVIAVFGTAAVSIHLENTEGDDPSEVVIDEVLGMIVGLIFVPINVGSLVTVFVLFRIFDIIAPPPISWLEEFGGATGVMADDVVAGLIANLIIQMLV